MNYRTLAELMYASHALDQAMSHLYAAQGIGDIGCRPWIKRLEVLQHELESPVKLASIRLTRTELKRENT